MSVLPTLLITLAATRWRAVRAPVALAAALLCSGLAHAAGLNDTGITNCVNGTFVVSSSVAADSGTHPRQDCRYGRDAAAAAGNLPKVGGGMAGFDFTKIANNGSALPATATLGSGANDWACTRDNVTGLIWEVKTTSGLRSMNHTYTWYNSNNATNGGSAGRESEGICYEAGRCDTEKFVADVNAVGLCGASNWRMPMRQELESIKDYDYHYDDHNSPLFIDSEYFPNTIASSYWSGVARPDDGAWHVVFGSFRQYMGSGKYFDTPVRLVRAGQ